MWDEVDIPDDDDFEGLTLCFEREAFLEPESDLPSPYISSCFSDDLDLDCFRPLVWEPLPDIDL